MTLRNRLLSRLLACSLFLGAVATLAEMARVPAQQAGRGQERLNYDEKGYKSKARDIKSMFLGEQPADKKALDLAAQQYAYRLTWTELQGKQGEMQGLVQSAINELEANRREDRKVNEAVQQFNTALLARLKEVLPNPRPIASIGAARILAHMAKLGQEEATDVLAEALNDKDMNDGTKFWAARGMRDFFMLAFPTGDEPAIYFKDKEREARCIKALLAALDMKPPQNPPPKAEEIEGLRYHRREIIRALGVSRFPAIVDAKGASQGKTALALLRVMRNAGLNPPPRLDEQVDAAVGLAMLKMMPNKDYKPTNEYQLDVGAYHFGRFLVDFARRHQSRKDDNTAQPSQAYPWKTSGARLSVALDALSKEAAILNRNDPTKYKNTVEYVQSLVKLCQPVLKAVEADGSALPDQLAQFLENKPRDAEPIYKGDPGAVVTPGSAALTTEPPKEKAGPEEKK